MQTEVEKCHTGYTTSVMAVYKSSVLIPDDVRGALEGYSPLVSQLLFARGITTKELAQVFIAPNFDTDRHNPFLMTDMEKAVSRVLKAFQNNERIAIWSDYDCDGIPGGVLLHDFFKLIGVTNFINYIPHRHNEGFGLNAEGIDTLTADNVTLVITIDCGITNVQEVNHARALGCDVIITDHHEPDETLPDAFAILDPKRDTAYPFRDLCGSGVMWKLIEGLMERIKTEKLVQFSHGKGQEKWLLDMVGIATLADMVPLVGENRTLAYYGLSVMRKSRRAGFRELIRVLRLTQQFLTEDDIGFSIAPRINAASRMGSPQEAFALFTADADSSVKLAERLEHINSERKGYVGAITKEAKARLKEKEIVPDVIVMGNPEWRPSLLGLVANSLAQEFKRPVFLWGRDGRNVLKGSCRSDGIVSVVSLMREASETLSEFGGHHMSGGFAITDEHIHQLPEALNRAYAKIKTHKDDSVSVILVDADLSLSEVSDRTFRDISALSPFGVGNQKPLFRFLNVSVVRVEQFGKTKEHLKLRIRDERTSVEAIAFFSTVDTFTRMPKAGEQCDLIGHIESSYFRSRRELRLRIVDIV